MPADLAAEMTPAPRRSASRPGWRRARPTTSAASATRSRTTSSCATATSPASTRLRAPLRRAARRLRARPDDRRAAPAVRASCARRSSRSSPPPATRASRATTASSRASSRVEAQRVAVLDAARGASASTPTPGAWTRRCTRSRRAWRPTDVRLTTRYDEHDFGVALYSVPARVRARPLRGAAVDPALLPDDARRRRSSLGVHESQSRLWENIVGRSRPFCAWLLPRLRATLPGRSTRARRRPRSTARSTRSSRR